MNLTKGTFILKNERKAVNMSRVSRKGKSKFNGHCTLELAKETYKTGVYIRLSGEEGVGESNHKLENQERVIRNYIKERQEFNISKVYYDNGCTGTNFSRTSFEELIRDVKTGEINCIIVKDLSRLGRNYIETEQYIKVLFPFLNVRFIAINDNFDTLNPDDDITVSLKNIVNDAYAKDISKKIFSAKQTQMLKGEFVGNIPPFGYEKSKANPHKLVVNETTGQIVKKIFDLKQQKRTNTEIARILNESGEIAPMTYWYGRGVVHHQKYANRIWEATTVKVILRNQTYTGDMVQGKKQKCLAEGRTKVKAQKQGNYVIVKNTHEPLIEKSIFEKVQLICNEQLQENRKKRTKYKEIQSSGNLLENLVFSKDGQKMYRHRNVDKNQQIIYNYTISKTRKDDGSYFPFFCIGEANLWDSIKKVLYIHIEMLFFIQKITDNKNTESRVKEINTLKRKKAGCVEELISLHKDMSERVISLTEYEKAKAICYEKKYKAEEELKYLKGNDTSGRMLTGCYTEYQKGYKGFLKRRELTRELIQSLVKKITVIEKKKISVTFLFEDEIHILYEKAGEGGMESWRV